MMELLAPAGDRDALLAAIAAGADAVYLGYRRFGARGQAGNFDEDGLREAIALCHVRNIRVHVTVNTLIKQGEMADVMALLSLLCGLGVDAIILQDLGLLSLARRHFPDLPLHASTQMTLHNGQGVAWARRQGIRRVVAGRECALEELTAMAGQGLEIEAFVHGALCVSVSGQCLFSSMLGERSGNRGQCAQPCRLPYRWGEQRGALLSPKDQMLMALLPGLYSAGVCSLKIEGRMKKPEYVYGVTRAYREALDKLSRGEDPSPDEPTVRGLMQVFHRGGFSRGHAGGGEDADLIYPAFSGHEGVPLGPIRRLTRPGLAEVRVETRLGDGDLLRVGEKTLVYSGPPVESGGIARIRAPFPVQAGQRVFKQSDAALQRAAQAAAAPRIPVTMALRAFPGEAAELYVSDGERSVCVTTEEAVAPALQRAMDAAFCCRQLGKTGSTPFELADCSADTAGAYLSAAALNDLRVRGLDALAAARMEAASAVYATDAPDLALPSLPGRAERLLLARGAEAGRGRALLQAGASAFEWMPEDYRLSALSEQCERLPDARLCRLVLPEVLGTRALESLRAWVRSRAERFCGVVTANPSQLELDWGLPVHADAPLHAFNPWAAKFLFDAGCESVTASPELTLGQLQAMTSLGGSFAVQVYGRERLMLLSHCPSRVAAGCVSGHAACRRCEAGQGVAGSKLYDRQGVGFPLGRVRTEETCRVRLLNSVPTDLTGHWDRLAPLNADFRLSFTDEPLDERLSVVRHVRALLEGKACPANDTLHTTGHFFRDVL